MTGAQVTVLATVVGALIGVVGLVITIRQQAKKQAEAERKAKQELYDQGVLHGRVSRDDEVRQLTFERDDARRERDANAARAADYESRYMNLLDRRRGQ